jgi:hypothetical protein
VTDFSPLLEMVKSIGVSLTERSRLITEDLVGGIEIDSKSEYISTPSGFFELLPNGDIVRLVLHLGAYHGTTQNGLELSDPSRWHKFHLTACASINGAPPSRRFRYVKTRRSDGRFPYRVYNGSGVEFDPPEVVRGRPLSLCGSCRNKIEYRMGFEDLESERDLTAFLNQYASVAMRFVGGSIRYDHDAVRDFARDEWHEIARYAKDRRGWRCARCARDCSQPSSKRFLDAHCTEGILPGAVANVVPLCLACHSKQPGSSHRRIRSLPEYGEFLKTYPDAA